MVPVGRRRTLNHDLPPGMHRKRGRYYYGRADVALGDDFPTALRRYAELHGAAVAGPATFSEAARLYIRDELKKRAPKTQSEYTRQLALLVKIYGPVKLAAIEPQHVRQMIVEAGNTVAAARLKAVLSLVFNYARSIGLTSAANPCAGIRGKKAKDRRYVTDDELRAVLRKSDATLRDFLELCYYTGQDAGRVRALTRADIRDEVLWVKRSKTEERVRIEISGPLKRLLERLTRRDVGSLYLVRDERGQPLTLQALQRRFQKARKAAGATWKIRQLRPKAATDLENAQAANALLAHAAMSTTDGYIRQVAGRKAAPVMREIADTTPGIADNTPSIDQPK